MQDTRTLEKINGPNLSAFILRRPKLVLKFRETIGKAPSSDEKRAFLYKLAVFFAPAGYGKTTFLADFIQQAAIPCCWYFLDYADTDELTFLKFLLLSIRLCFPKFSAGFDLLLDNADTTDFYNSTKVVDSTLIVDSLVAAINAEIQEDFVICLCNYHEVNANKRINKLVNHLLRKLPVNCLLIIESRAVPLLDFSSLLTHNEIVGFDSNFLCFNAAEICDLADLQEMTPITKIEAEQLNMLFSGWITGILLGTHLGDRRILHARRDLYKPLNSPEIHIDRQSLLEYLVDRVFKHEPQVYDFLKEVVVLRQMEPELCDVLLSITDSNEHLQYLEQQGLFITRVNIMTPIIYICHPVLREIFCEELRRHSPERFLWLHQRATELYSAARRFEQAIDHALTANLTENAAFFILEIHEEFFAQGRVEILSHWIDLLPATVLECYPALLLTRAKIHMLAREFTLALPFLETAS